MIASKIATKREPPTTIDGAKVVVCGNPIAHHADGAIWLKLRAYDRTGTDRRRWLFCQETGVLKEGDPE